MKIAVAQFAAGTDKTANNKSVAELIGRAADEGARVVVLPENSMFTTPTASPEVVEAAEPLDGPFRQHVSRAASTHGVYVVVGMSERIEDEPRVHNTLLALSPSGELISTYRKLHLYDAFGYRESDNVRPGDHGQLMTFSVEGFTIGAMTCYDLRFPELGRRLADAGCHVVALPAAWVAGPVKEDHWTTLVRARAIENTLYVAASGQAPPRCAGHSMIVDPMGIVRAALGEDSGVAVADVDLERLESVRRTNPSLRHRRFDTVER